MKVQNEMSTRISVETVSAIGSLSAFRNAIKATSNAWRAQETALKNSGDYSGAVREKLRGLNQVMELQRAKIKELRQEQEGLDTSNKKQANQFLKLEKQISQANRQLASYDIQARRARSAAAYQVSGLADLQKGYRAAESSSRAYVNRLNAEGKSASATVERFRALKSSLSNLESQYRKQEFLLKQVANESGRDSDAYRKQKEQLDKTATSIAKTRSEMNGLSNTVARLQPTGIKRIDDAVIKVENHTGRMRARVSSAFSKIKENAVGVAATVGTIGVALVDSARKASALQKTYVENQNLMSTAGEKSAAAQKEVNQMYSQGQKLSVQYGVSQKEIADGYQTLIKRGYDGKQSLGAMNSILKASKASGDSFDDTMRVTTSTLESFGMKTESTSGMMRNTAKVADTLAKAADVTSTNFQDIGTAMTYAGASAKASGVSLRETSGILGVLSNHGMEASQAGTSLQRILTRLIAPTDTAKAALKKYNLSIDDFKDKSGKLIPVNDIFKKINKNVPSADRMELFNKVFGQTAQNAAYILDNSSKDLDKVNNQLKSAYKEDYAGKLAEKNMKSAKNSTDRFKYATQAIQIELGRNMLPAISKASQAMAEAFMRKDTQNGLKVLSKGIGSVASALVSMITFMGKHTTTVKIFGGALLTAFSAFKVLQGYGAVMNTLREFPKTMTLIKNTILGVKDAVKVLTLGFNPWVIGIGLATAALIELYKHSKTFRKICNDMGKLAVKAGKAIVKGFKAVINWFKSDWKQIALFMVNPIAGGIALLYKHNKTFRKFVNNLAKDARTGLRKVGNFFKSAWKGIERTSSRAWKNQQRENRNGLRDAQRTWDRMSRNVSRTSKSMWRRASRDARNGWNYVARWGNRSSKGIARTWNWMNRQTTRASQRMFRSHERTFRAGYRVIEDQTKTWKDLTSGHWDRLYDDTSRTARDMNKYHQRLFKDMYNKLNDMTGGRLGDMLKTWQDKMSSIGDAVANAKQSIHTHFVDLVRGVIKPFNDMLAGIQKGINWVLDKIGASKIGGNWQVPMPSYAQGTLGAHPGGFAKVNDGKTGHYREMYKLPNGVVGMFPAVRDMIVPLPKGTAILDGEKTYSFMRMMGKIPHYATGTLDAVGNFFGNLKDDVESFMDNIDKFIDHPVELMESVFKKFIRVSTPIKFATDMIQHFPVYVAQQMKNWLKKQLEEFSGPNGGAASEGLIRRAAAMMHVHPSDAFIHNLMQVIMNESGNRSVMQTIHDMNSGGNEAGGILQYTPGTFATYAMPGHTNRMNPLDELLAFFNNSDWENSIGWTTIWGHRKMEWLHSGPQGHRRLSHFANGGLVDRHQLIEIAEGNKPEYVIPTDINKRSRAYQLLGEIIARFHADEPAQAHINSGYGKKIDQLNAKFDRLLDMFGQLLGATDNQTQAIQAQGSLDTKQLYKKMARDKAMRQFG